MHTSWLKDSCKTKGLNEATSLVQTCVIHCVNCSRVGQFILLMQKRRELETILSTVFYAVRVNAALPAGLEASRWLWPAWSFRIAWRSRSCCRSWPTRSTRCHASASARDRWQKRTPRRDLNAPPEKIKYVKICQYYFSSFKQNRQKIVSG